MLPLNDTAEKEVQDDDRAGEPLRRQPAYVVAPFLFEFSSFAACGGRFKVDKLYHGAAAAAGPVPNSVNRATEPETRRTLRLLMIARSLSGTVQWSKMSAVSHLRHFFHFTLLRNTGPDVVKR